MRYLLFWQKALKSIMKTNLRVTMKTPCFRGSLGMRALNITQLCNDCQLLRRKVGTKGFIEDSSKDCSVQLSQVEAQLIFPLGTAASGG